MKLFKLFYLIPLVLGVLMVTSCDDDEDEEPTPTPKGNEITITILEPTADEVFADCSDVHVHIEIEATDENHEVEIVLHPEGDVNDKIIDYDEHNHDQKIEFEQDFDLCSYPSGTCFHLEVEACTDHDCEGKETADVEFCLQ